MLEIQSSSRGEQNFFIFIQQKKFYIYFLLKKYRQVSAIFTDTDTTSRYHKNRPIPPIPILKYRYILTLNIETFLLLTLPSSMFTMILSRWSFDIPECKQAGLRKLGRPLTLAKIGKLKILLLEHRNYELFLKVETTLNNYMYSNC